MGNIIHTSSGSGKNKKNNSAVVKNSEQQLRLFKANPVFTMFLKFVENLEHQVQLFKAKYDFTVVSDYVKKVEQYAQLLNERYVFPIFYKFLNSLALKPQEEEEDTKSVVLYQVTFYFLFSV